MARKLILPNTKQKALVRYNAGESVDLISKDLDIAKSTIYNWVSNTPAISARQTYTFEKIRDVLKQIRSGDSIPTVSAKAGISVSTCYLWLQKYKDLDIATTAYSNQFKRNVINSLHDGHSKIQVSNTYGITLTQVSEFVEEFRNGKFDTPQVALKAKPDIQTATNTVIDSFVDVFKLLVSKGLDVDSSVDVAKQLSAKLK
jgi:transposase